jgi:acyl-CoA thioester hydrolase
MSYLYKNFRHVTPIQIRFNDIDAMNHLNNAVYLTYFELARIQYFDKVLQNNWKDIHIGLILAKAEINYKKPVFFSDHIEIYVRCQRVGTKSFDLEYEMVKTFDNGEKQIAATGVTIQVAFNYETQQSVLIPEVWRKYLSAFEQNPLLA